MTPNRLPADVAELYESLVEPTVVIFPRPINREIDLRSISLEDAELVAACHPDILVRRPVKPKADAAAKKSEKQG